MSHETNLTAAHAPDADRLAGYLRAQVHDFRGDLQLEKFAGGQSNPTYLVTAGERRYVIRRKPPGALLASAHAIDREYRVIQALAGSGVPVPAVHALCEDDSVIGTAFYVMEFVPGRVFWDPSLPGMEAAQRAAIYDELNRVIAALHSVDYAAAACRISAARATTSPARSNAGPASTAPAKASASTRWSA